MTSVILMPYGILLLEFRDVVCLSWWRRPDVQEIKKRRKKEKKRVTFLCERRVGQLKYVRVAPVVCVTGKLFSLMENAH
jgi:predicted Ser/Thr protein kinase